MRVPPPYHGAVLAAVPPEIVIFKNEKGLWYLGPEGRLRDHLRALSPDELLPLLAVLRDLNPRHFWMDRDLVRQELKAAPGLQAA